MKKNLNYQLKVKLKLLKKKQKPLFLRAVFLNANTSSDAKLMQLSVLFRSSLIRDLNKNNSSFSRVTSQCILTWRTRSVYSFFNLSRISLRELSSFGLIKGLRKSSW
jgi:ribosomal protein S14